MQIQALLTPENIEPNFAPLPPEVWPALIALVRSRAALSGAPDDFEAEELHLLHGHPNEGLAILHNLSAAVDRILLILALAPGGVTLQGQSCQVLAVLISPLKDSGAHIQVLSRLTSLLRSRSFREELLTKGSPEEIIRAVRRQEQSGHENYWVLSREEIIEELQTNLQGLTPEEARRRLTETGPNRIQRLRRRSLILRFGANFVNLFALLLWAASGFAWLAGMTELAAAIPLVILINAVFSFWQEYRAEKAIEALAKLLPAHSRLVRNGQVTEVEAGEIVPGDIILLEAGDQIPADARLIEAEDFRADNSALTGESHPAYKVADPVSDGQEFLWNEMPNLVFAGTAALSGSAKGVVIATGMDTQLGNIASLTQEVPEQPSPLQKEMRVVARVVAAIACSMGVIFFLMGVLTGKLTVVNGLVFAIGMIVAFVPEGLLPTLSLSLALAGQRMAGKNALVKKLSAVETLGAATVICTDKTGTLTTNEIMVQHIRLGGDLLSVTGSGFKVQGRLELAAEALPPEKLASPLLELFLTGAILCNNASLAAVGEGVVGDPTEAALLVLAAKAGRDQEEIRQQQPRVQVFPFESVRKRMSTINASPGGARRCWVKGAPDTLIPRCSTITDWDGSRRPLTARDRTSLIQVLNDLAQQGLRLLALAGKEVETGVQLTQTQAESDLSFLGITGMIDPPRPEVPAAIEKCRRAGIRIVMVTGDFGGTARAVAQEIGMRLDQRVPLLTGEQVSRLSDVQLRQLLKRKGDMIFARTSPEEKLRIVAGLRHLGEIVAVTGDGVNDGPALKAADIGVAMGKRGTEVSKEAASMVLADDNFATIVAAIEEGRAVYANIKKFIVYIFNSNIPEAVPFVLFVLFGIPLPLTIMQILAVDLGTDLLPGLALGAEAPEPGIMDRPPRSRKARLIDWSLARRFVFLGVLNAGASMAAYYFVYFSAGWRPGLEMAASGPLYARATTMCLGGIVAAQIGNGLAIRTERESVFRVGLFSNRLLLVGIVSEIMIFLALSYVPFLQRTFGTASLEGRDLLFLLIFPPIMLGADELRKAWGRRRGRLSAGVS
ncbi:MAG: HAD-IC family P-type ATPase [Proteobacteria bacterium]|nr:HAD-IC family P-type ATPase [Pseudomonadota bacterium]